MPSRTPDCGHLLRTAYADAVAVTPNLQGRGVGSAVKQHLAATVANYDVACLETDKQSFHQRLGWERHDQFGRPLSRNQSPAPSSNGRLGMNTYSGTSTPNTTSTWPTNASGAAMRPRPTRRRGSKPERANSR